MITIDFSSSDVAALVSVVSLFAVTLLTMMNFFNSRRNTKYDTEKHRIELEMMRRSIESQMYILNEKLMATQERWKDANHLLMSSQDRQPDDFDLNSVNNPVSFLQTSGLSKSDLQVQENLVFVLTPFHPRHKQQFDVISSVCQELGLIAMRGDEEYIEGDVFPHILKLITRARIVIAIIEGRNSNVFYELGIAHALGKTTILVAPTPEDVPFDVRAKRLILFKGLDELKTKLQAELARAAIKTRIEKRILPS